MKTHVPKGFKSWHEYYQWRNAIDIAGTCLLIALLVVYMAAIIVK